MSAERTDPEYRMIDYGKRNIIGVGVDALDYASAVAKVVRAAKCGMPFGATALASHGVMTGFDDPQHRHRLNALELVTPDGQPVRWALNWLYGLDLEDRVAGPEFALKVMEAAVADSLPVYFYGSSTAVLGALCARMTSQFPGLVISGCEPSKFRQLTAIEQTQVIDRIKSSGAKIVFVGLGCPRQEVWVYENRAALSMPALAVGAAFGFHAGLSKRAPKWMAKHGLEWGFRLLREPMRMWRRYLILGPRYVLYVAMQYMGLKRYPIDNTSAPNECIHYG